TALTTVAGLAREEGPEDEVYLRVAGDAGRVWIDLADAERRVVEIDSGGWRNATEVPVRFLRPPGMLPLPAPVSCGSLGDLDRFRPRPGRGSGVLGVAFLLGPLHPEGPSPVLSLTGPEGSAKSTAARVLRELVDPNRAPLRAPPGDVRDLAVATRGSWVI